MHRRCFLFFCLLALVSLKAASQLRLKPLPDTVKQALRLAPLPQNFYKQHLGFFCRQELQVQKLTALPLYIRVGAKDDVDFLEKKPNATRRF